MKKFILLLIVVAQFHFGCTDAVVDHQIPEATIPDIGYTKIDSVLAYNKHLSLDLNSDGKYDFNFSSVLLMEGGKSYLYLQVKPNGAEGNKVLLSKDPELTTNGMWAYPLATGSLITETPESGSIWSSSTQTGSIINVTENSQPEFDGLWNGQQDKYLAVRTASNGMVQYGWIRISHLSGQKKVLIHDMGSSLVSGKSIKAGQKNPF